MRAGLYARISLDRHDGAGVDRQLEDGRALATARKWKITEEYVDNSISAYKRKKRPEWDRLIADVAAGRLDMIVAWHPDRTYRRMRDLEDLIDTVEDTGCGVACVMAGDLDLSTPSGRMQARQWAVFNRYQVEHMAEQVSRERMQRAAAGKPACGGLRPFGYELDKVTIREEEARWVRESAASVAAGGSLWAEARSWNGAGLTTTAGNPWEVTALRRVLTSPRIAGLRVHKGQVVGDAAWPAIIDRDTHARIVAMTRSRVGKRAPSASWLLSTLIPCPRCGGPLYGSSRGTYRAYACAPSPGTGRGCGGASVSAVPVEAKVVRMMDGWLANPPRKLERWLAGPKVKHDPTTEAEAIARERATLTRLFAEGLVPEEELVTNLETFAKRLARANAPAMRTLTDSGKLR